MQKKKNFVKTLKYKQSNIHSTKKTGVFCIFNNLGYKYINIQALYKSDIQNSNAMGA